MPVLLPGLEWFKIPRRESLSARVRNGFGRCGLLSCLVLKLYLYILPSTSTFSGSSAFW